MALYDTLQTYRFFQLFREISEIPRESGNEKAVSDYIVQFAGRHGLTCYQDKANNVVIKKPAAPGYEDAPAVMLQAHLDMVCEKRPDSPHNFITDPIAFVVREGELLADNTTLGADDGFGIGYMLAVLEDRSLAHPAIEAVFTTDEEVGMGGMQALDVANLASRRLINLDSEEEGELCASCAGGVRYDMEVPVTATAPPTGCVPYRLVVEGLNGGHSGMDIGRERANSILLLARVLDYLGRRAAFWLSDFTGGTKTNAIPREAYATLWIAPDELPALRTEFQLIKDICKREYAVTEPALSIRLDVIETPQTLVLDIPSLNRSLAALRLLPNGAFSYNQALPGVLDSSSNIGIASLRSGTLFLSGLVRSNTNSKITDSVDKLKALSALLDATLETNSAYPAWEFKKESILRTICCDVYQRMYDKQMVISSTHGGLECALLAEKLPDMDMISIGPNIRDAHTPQERIDMDSFIRVWEYLIQVLKELRK